ncbi:MAG: Zn-dependent M28 family amino/carboxypeptidase [Ulvibacter sp.]|jgi:Zn-dependent M28 family amino/carboxypeptidase
MLSGQEINPLAIKYAKTITKEDLSRHLHIISSDEYEGRETGLKGQKMTEKYLTTYYKSIGITEYKDTYVQGFEVILKDQERVEMAFKKKTFTFIDDFYYYPPGIQDTTLQGEVVYAGYGITDPAYDDISTLDLTNKVVVIKDGEPSNNGIYTITGEATAGSWSAMREKKTALLESKGALAVLVIKENYSDNIDRLKSYFSHKSMDLVDNLNNGNDGMPLFYISLETAKRILGKGNFKKCVDSPKELSGYTKGKTVSIAFKRNDNIMETTNVLAYIPGSDKKDEVIVISAHYDHIGVEGDEVYNGADDDGSGTVAVMEIAEAFQKAKMDGNGPRRSLLFLNVSGEEKGLLGSEYYSENPVFPLEKTVANLNIDMIGRVDDAHPNDSEYVYIIGSNMLSQDLHDVNEEAQKKYSDIKLDYRYNSKEDPNKFYYRSDHYNFAKNNIPVIFYFTGVHEDYHKPTDTVDKIMFDKLTRITQLIYHTAWDLANRDERIKLINP